MLYTQKNLEHWNLQNSIDQRQYLVQNLAPSPPPPQEKKQWWKQDAIEASI